MIGALTRFSGDPEVVEDSDFEAFSMEPVGTGPYKISEFIPGQRVVYERFDDFWARKRRSAR